MTWRPLLTKLETTRLAPALARLRILKARWKVKLAWDMNLKQRVISAAILAPVALFCLVKGGIWFTLMLTLATILMLLEWHRLTERRNHPEDLIFLFVPSIFAALLGYLGHSLVGLAILGCAIAVRLLGQLWQQKPSLWPVVGLVYIMVPVLALFYMMGQTEGYLTVLWLFFVVWATDIGGYFFGRLIGGPKLLPSISPKKTWSGLGGAILCAALTGLIMAWMIQSPPLLVTLLSAALAVIAQVGDLFESKIKRIFNKKDSGTLIPGHGGILDRVDGLLAAAMVLWGAIVFDAHLTFNFQQPTPAGQTAEKTPS